MSATLIAIAPVLCAAAGGVFAMIADAFFSRKAAVWAAAVGLFAGAGVAVYAFREVESTRISLALIGAGAFSSAAIVILILSGLALLGGMRSLSEREPGGGIAALIAFGAAGSVLLATSLDLTMSLIALETIAVCSYALVASARTPESAEAAMKYAVQGAVATGLFLMGLAIYVGVLGGSGDIVAGSEGVRDAVLPATAATVLLLSVYAFKLGAVPFHSWAPDAFETAPPAASAFMASAPKFAATYGLLLVLAVAVEPFRGGVLNPGVLLAGLALFSIVLGNLAALKQRSYTRMLGYSGIAQVGYALVGLAVGSAAFAPSVMLVAVYGLAVVGAFLTAEALVALRPDWDGTIAGMAGLGRERPVLALGTAVAMFSLTGIPLTAGFWGKLFVFGYAVSSGYAWLVAVALIGSVVSFGYYGAVLRSMYFDAPPSMVGEGEAPRITMAEFIIAITALGVLAGGIAPVFTAQGITPFLMFFQLG